MFMVSSSEVSGDGESLALVEAYLDRRMPGWRDDIEGDAAAGAGGASDEDDLDFGGDEPSPDAPASAEGRPGTPVDAYGDGHLFNRRA